MRQCLLLGYGQVDLLTKKHTDNYWVEKRLIDKNASDGVGVTSNKELIRNTIEKLLPSVDSFEQMGYTEEKMRSIRYKMALYDDFSEEFNYRKKHYGVRETSRIVEVHEKNRGAR